MHSFSWANLDQFCNTIFKNILITLNVKRFVVHFVAFIVSFSSVMRLLSGLRLLSSTSSLQQ